MPVVKSALHSALLGAVAFALVACNKTPDNNAPDTSAAASAQSAPAIGNGVVTSAPSGSRFKAIAPNNAALASLHLNYDTFVFAPDGTSLMFVPLPPKAGDVVVGIETAGTYKVKLTDSHCAFDVKVTPSEGAPFTLNTAAPQHAFTVTKPAQITVVMDEAATNNYSCNVDLTPG